MDERAKPRKINFSENEWDLECALLAEAGWSTMAIAKETGLTLGQVTGRCQLAGVKRKYYRDGTSRLSNVVRDLLLYRYDKARMAKITQTIPSQVLRFQQDYSTHKERLKREREAAYSIPKRKVALA